MPWNLGCPRLPPERASVDACVWRTADATYASLKEIAYENFEGASAGEVLGLMCTFLLIVSLQQLVAFAMVQRGCSRGMRAVAETVAAVVPLSCTFSAPHLVWLSAATMLAVCMVAAALSTPVLAWPRLLSRGMAARAARKAAGLSIARFSRLSNGHLRFVTEYRAVIMMTTCVAILAVDFPSIFARTHAKTEEFGYSLMDLGTGSIVCASAICSRAARGLRQGRRPLAVIRRIVSLWPVLAIGIARLVVLKEIDYHVPTSEYGTHWNFFFTVAVVALVSTACDLGPGASVWSGGICLLAYQMYLSCFDGSAYILRAPRTNLFSANREGILSCFGFLGLHWLAVALGAVLATASPDPASSAAPGAAAAKAGGDARSQSPSAQSARTTLWALGGAAAFGLGLSACLEYFGVAVSRRMCNLPYVAFILGTNALVLWLLALLDLWWPLLPRPSIAPLFAGVSDSMLVVFLVANLLTGAVNLAFQTLLVPSWAAVLIMNAYCFAWAIPFALLGVRRVAVKLW